MINLSNKLNKFIFVLVFIISVLLVTKGLKFVGWSSFSLLSTLRYDGMFLLPIAALILKGKIMNKNYMRCRKFVSYFIFACFFTFLLRILLYGGGLGYGLECNLFVAFIFCVYYILHYVSVSEELLIKSLTIIGVAVFVIQVFQQINPSMAMFSTYTEEMREEIGLSSDYITGQRNGLYRFIPLAANVPVFLSCYYFSKMLNDTNIKNMVLTLVFVASMYFMLTRMFMICTGICFLYILLSKKRRNKSHVSSIAIILLIITSLIVYGDVLFSDLFSSTNSDIEYSSTARMQSLPFIFGKAFSNPILFITGHGYPSILWKWGADLGYWYNDLGIFGQVFPYGIIWVGVYFYLVYFLLIKMKKKLPTYIKAYTFGLFCICFMMTSYANRLETTLLWCIILYISDLYIGNSDKTEHNAI